MTTATQHEINLRRHGIAIIRSHPEDRNHIGHNTLRTVAFIGLIGGEQVVMKSWDAFRIAFYDVLSDYSGYDTPNRVPSEFIDRMYRMKRAIPTIHHYSDLYGVDHEFLGAFDAVNAAG